MKFIFAFLFITLEFVQNTSEKNYLLGRFDPSSDARFVQLSSAYAQGSALNGFLRKETFEAFQKMADAAKKDGINIFIISATRNFDSQKKIWKNKWIGKAKAKITGVDLSKISDLKARARQILLYSAMPGTSRHHWGTDIDLNSFEDNYFLENEGWKVYRWLSAHASDFWFCQPYTSKANVRTGYEEEKWHWSYLPLSKFFLEEYQKEITYADITGFDGSETAEPLQIIDKYVNGVACY
jgi:D-alanyl-D-alanine carboxypeptidase